jgi:hypothetical protein
MISWLIRDFSANSFMIQSEILLLKAGKVTRVVQHLPTKCEALSSNTNTKKKSSFTFSILFCIYIVRDNVSHWTS